jgi:hypothetical protein
MLGMRGTGDWATNERPENWRQGILYLYPNGSAPLTAILSMMGEEMVDDPKFHWWTKDLPSQSATLTGKYTDVALSAAYASGGVSGSTIYAKMSAAHNAHFRIGHLVKFTYSGDHTVDCVGSVTAVEANGANSYVAVKLREADDNSSSYDISDADSLLIIGNTNPEGGTMPTAIAYDPVEYSNYTSILRTPLSITRTARRTKLRTKDAYQEQKREALELHSIEMEKAFLWSIYARWTGANGKFERSTMGVIPMIKTYASANVFDYVTDTDYSGQTWLQGGEDWLDAKLEVLFRYGSREKLALCGSEAVLGINRIVKSNGFFQTSAKTKSYGIQVMEWVTPFGVINMITHPLFSYEAANRRMMVVLEPKNLKYKYVDDTTFYAEGNPRERSSGQRVDGTEEEFLTECGLEYHHPSTFGIFAGMGQLNTA